MPDTLFVGLILNLVYRENNLKYDMSYTYIIL